MKKIVLVFILFLFSIQLIAQSKENKTIRIVFYFNNYRVCDVKGNAQLCIFYVDSNNFYRLDTMNIYDNNKVDIDFDFEKNEVIGIIFRYKKYILSFDNDIEEFITKNIENKLTFRIAKKNNYKKYIRKSYSKRKQNDNSLYIKDFDVSCNGYIGGLNIFSRVYRKDENKHFDKIGFSDNKNNYVSMTYSYSPWNRSSMKAYKNYKTFLSKEKEFFQQMLFLVGKEK